MRGRVVVVVALKVNEQATSYRRADSKPVLAGQQSECLCGQSFLCGGGGDLCLLLLLLRWHPRPSSERPVVPRFPPHPIPTSDATGVVASHKLPNEVQHGASPGCHSC